MACHRSSRNWTARLRASRYGGHPSPSASEGWSGLRGSNPSNWLGKPEHYHYAKPARCDVRRCDSSTMPSTHSTSRSNQRRAPRRASAAIMLRRRRLEVQPQQRLGVRRPHVEVPVGILDRDAVQRRTAGRRRTSRAMRVELRPARRPCSRSFVLISPEMKYFCAQRLRAARAGSGPSSTSARGSAAPG